MQTNNIRRRTFLSISYYVIIAIFITLPSPGIGSDEIFVQLATRITCAVHDIREFAEGSKTNPLFDNSYRFGFESFNDSSPVSTILNSDSAELNESQAQLQLPFLLKLNGSMSLEESLYLVYLNLANGLQKGHNELPVFPEIKWKQRLMNKMAEIFYKTCQFVPQGYIHVVKEMFVHYQNHLYAIANRKEDLKTHEKDKEESNDTQTDYRWDTVENVLGKCLENAEDLHLVESSGLILGLQNSIDKQQKINPPEEDADNEPRFRQKDDIIEGAWWLFSFIYGYCFPHFQSKTSPVDDDTYQSSNEFFMLFERDFLMDLKLRWLDTGKYSKSFGTIFGKFNNTLVKRNLRYCVTAAYLRNSIEDFQLVRPISFRFDNSRTGTSIS